MIRRLIVLLAAALMLAAAPARADDNRPLSVSIVEEGGDSFRVTWKIPANVEARHLPQLSAEGCQVEGRARNWSDPMGWWHEENWACPDGIVGRAVSIAYPLANPNLATIVRYHPAGEDAQTLLLQPQDGGFAIPAVSEGSNSFLEFLILGIEHIWIGIDHLLFVAGLIFIARTPRRVLTTITGFTIAHSITLALSVLDVVRLPIAAVEGVIALSIVFLAVEIVKGERDTLTWRRPVVVASAFGLLHGFGFAAVLREIGLPTDGFVAALFAFNLGIEVGQVIFAALVLLILRALAMAGQGKRQPLPAAKMAGYGVGMLASYWMFERLIG